MAVVSLALGCASGDELGGSAPAFPPAPGADNPNGVDDDDDADDDRDDVSFLGCCQRHDEPGCQDPDVESCICDAMPECCTDGWTEACIVEGVNFGCMECMGREPDANADGGNADGGNVDDGTVDDGAPNDDGAVDDGADSGMAPGGPKGGCCDQNTTPGCTDASIESCVCAEDDYCCTDEWDDICVGIVDSAGCGTCGGTQPSDDDGGGTDDGGPAPAGTCCSAVNTPGCSDLFIEDCVCFEDAFCCDFAWDATCVALVESARCGTC